MKNWKFIKTGNEAVGPNWDKKRQLEDELRGWMTMVNKLDGDERRNAEKQIADIRKELNDVKIKIAHGENKKAVNESINKQVWSMFKGLTKDAEKEVGNELPTEQDLKNWIRMMEQDKREAQREMDKWKHHTEGQYSGDQFNTAMVKYNEAVSQIKKMQEELRQGKYKKVGNETYQHKLYPDKYVIIDGKNYKIITDGKVEKSGELTDAVLYGINQTYKRVSSMNSKTGNKAIVLKDGNVWVVLYANETKSQEFESEAEAREFAKKVGNETLGQWAKSKPRVINDESTEIRDDYIREIYRLERKRDELERKGQGYEARKVREVIRKLERELHELGNKKIGNTNWKQTGSNKWETELPNGSKIVVYYQKGEMADWNYQIDHKKSNTYIGSWARDKQEAMTESVERAKRLGNEKISYPENKLESASWTTWKYIISNPDKYDEKTVEKARNLLKIKTENETKGERKFGKVMGEFERGELKSGSGEKVTDPAQAKAIAYSEADKVDNLKRARNAMAKNKQITLWNGNDTVLISEDGIVQYLESNAFETDRAKFESQEKAIEELTKQGYRNK